MKASTLMAGVTAALLLNGSVAHAQGKRHVLMEGTGEFGWSISRPSKIDGEAEGRALALAAVNGQVNTMANLEAFEQFSKAEVKKTISNKFEKIGPAVANTTTFTTEQKKEEAFKGNLRGLVVTVEDKGFKPDTFTNSSDYNKLTQVRKSKASGVYLYTFRVYAPDGYNPNGGTSTKPPAGGKPGDDPSPPKPDRVEYSILNDADKEVRFRLPSGKEYTLKPGEVGQYFNTRHAKPTITILPSGKTYNLRDGNHKFWWMQKENRVALDLNWQK